MIIITKKEKNEENENRYHTISIRMTTELADQLETLAKATKRSRSNIINYLLREAVNLTEFKDNKM